MGRRALRKTDPSLDLSGHLRPLESLPPVCTAQSLFAREAPLEVEVGSGKGLFLRTAAAACPERCFLGIEIAAKYARFAAAGLARQGAANALVVQGDALRLFAERLADDSLAAVHVYFPDPWWKKRHHKRRLMRPEFVRDMQRVLAPGGDLHLWTDVEDYFRLSLETLAQATHLAGPFPVAEGPAEHDLDYRTHFERRTRLQHQQVYRTRFRKPPVA